MSFSASEYNVGPHDDAIEEAWTNELSSRVDEIVSGKAPAISGEDVFADIAVRRAARNA